MCLAQGPQRSDAGEARTRDPTLRYDCSHIEHVHPMFMHILYYIFECLT